MMNKEKYSYWHLCNVIGTLTYFTGGQCDNAFIKVLDSRFGEPNPRSSSICDWFWFSQIESVISYKGFLTFNPSIVNQSIVGQNSNRRNLLLDYRKPRLLF